jgi:hypothetical protein
LLVTGRTFEKGERERRRIEDAHARVLMLPALALRRQVRLKCRYMLRECFGNRVLA